MPNLDTTLSIRLSHRDKQAIKDRAAALGLDVSEHVRRASMSYSVTTPVTPVRTPHVTTVRTSATTSVITRRLLIGVALVVAALLGLELRRRRHPSL